MGRKFQKKMGGKNEKKNKYVYTYPIPNLVFNIVTGSYSRCISDFIKILLDKKTNFKIVEGVEFAIVRVEVSDREDDGVLLYIRRMDLYLLMIGMVRHGIYQLSKITEGPTVLPFGESYKDLGGLEDLMIGIEMFKIAIKKLVSFMREKKEKEYRKNLRDFNCWKRPIKTIAVFLCEGARNNIVHEDISIPGKRHISPWSPILIKNWKAVAKSAFEYTPEDGDFLSAEEVSLMYGKPLENETLLMVLERLKANHKVCYFMISLTWNFLARQIFEEDILQLLGNSGNMSLDSIATSLVDLQLECEVFHGQLNLILRELATEGKVELTDDGMYRKPRKHKEEIHVTCRATTALEMVEERNKKGHLNIVLFGPRDSGKTTIARKILSLTRPDNKIEGSRSYFETKRKRFTMLDAPGGKNCVEIIRCVSQADLGVLVVSASETEFQTGQEQTLEVVRLARTLGVRKLLVLVNKMETVSWLKERYDMIKHKLSPLFKSTGYNVKEDIQFLPVCGLKGINLITRVEKKLCEWIDGRSMLDVLDATQVLLGYPNSPFRMPIFQKLPTRFIITGNLEHGCFLIGKVMSGSVRKGNALYIMPEKVEVVASALRINQHEVSSAGARENLSVAIPRIKQTEILVGYVLSSIDRPIARVKEFIAEVFVLKLSHNTILSVGYEATLHVHSAVVSCEVIEIQTYERNTKRVIIGKLSAENGDVARCRIKVSNMISIERYVDMRELGSFILRKQEKTVAVGTVTELVLQLE